MTNSRMRGPAAAVALVLASLTFTADSARAQELGLAIGAKGPDAALETLDGKPTQLSSAIAGKPALIEFWATWCSNCRELEPTLVAAQQKYGKQVVFVGVAVGVNQSTERVRRYVAEHMLGFTHFYDRRGVAVEVYDVPATSYVVVLDRNGTVVYSGLGAKQDIEGAIQKALK